MAESAPKEEQWAGNKRLQEQLVRVFYESAMEANISPVDIAGAVETIIVNLICDNAPDLNTALEGLKAVYGDMQVTARQRFSGILKQ